MYAYSILIPLAALGWLLSDRKSFLYLSFVRLAPYILVSLLLLAAGFTAGIIYTRQLSPNQVMNASRQGTAIIRQLGTQSQLTLLHQILSTNIQVMAMNLLGGVCVGISSCLTTLYNGFMSGELVYGTYRYMGWRTAIRHIMPHSPETVAVVISFATGLMGARDFIAYVKSDHKPQLKQYFVLTCAVLVLTIYAAFFETFISTL